MAKKNTTIMVGVRMPQSYMDIINKLRTIEADYGGFDKDATTSDIIRYAVSQMLFNRKPKAEHMQKEQEILDLIIEEKNKIDYGRKNVKDSFFFSH